MPPSSSSYPPPGPPLSSPPSFNPSTPPPPPPKPTYSTPNPYPSSSHNPSQTGPPPPPPPRTSSASTSQNLATLTPSQAAEPPNPTDHWLPAIVLDKPTSALSPLLSSPPLLNALAQTHPSLNPSPLLPHLSHTSTLASHVLSTHAHLLNLRAATQQHLLQLLALERAWRAKQAQMDGVLEPWSAKVLYQRLREAEREAEDVSWGMEESFLEGDGRAGEREVGEFVRRWREGRGVVGRRREGRQRWDEGRVGGWR